MKDFAKIRDIGLKAGLQDNRLYIFIEFIFQRFPDYDAGYWAQWAKRFVQGTEVGASDQKGRYILGDITRNFVNVFARIEDEWGKYPRKVEPEKPSSGYDKQGFYQGMYRDTAPEDPVDLMTRANLLRAVSKSLIRFKIDRDQRGKIISYLCNDFRIELSEHGMKDFIDHA